MTPRHEILEIFTHSFKLKIIWNEIVCSPLVMINVDNAISMKSYIKFKTNEAHSM